MLKNMYILFRQTDHTRFNILYGDQTYGDSLERTCFNLSCVISIDYINQAAKAANRTPKENEKEAAWLTTTAEENPQGKHVAVVH